MKRVIIASVALLFGAVSIAQTAPVEKKKIKKQDKKEISHNPKIARVDKKELTKEMDKTAAQKKEIKIDKAEAKPEVKQAGKSNTHQEIQRVAPHPPKQ